VPPRYALAGGPLALGGEVVTGFGRGSRQLGVPTANIPPACLAASGRPLPFGVYFGWAQVELPAGAPAADRGVHKMVMNVGRRPTVNAGGEDASVELHLLHPFAADFYGRPLRALVLGHLRPEVRFAGLPQLLARIRTDVGVARVQLDDPAWAAHRADPRFQKL
jgi:riboflavin kinase